MNVCVHVCVQVCIHVCMCVSVYTCMCVYYEELVVHAILIVFAHT